MSTFGFRGVEFGNWVKQGKHGRERQWMLNNAFDSLKDLAEILNIPPKAVALNGELGLCFLVPEDSALLLLTMTRKID